MKTEKERFLIFYDRLVTFTHTCVDRLPTDMLHWQPVDAANVSFGDRVTDVTIESLYVHLVVGEHVWIRMLRGCAEGDTIPLPMDKALTAELTAEDYLSKSLTMHADNLAILEGFDADRMATSIQFSDREWTIQGMLWAIVGHRNYHIGNIDTYCRLAGAEAPDYFQFEPVEMA